MEQARDWMRGSSENKSKSGNFVAVTKPWEEEAFAEDAARPFGGLIWPRRSYSCRFCGREYRSAQALGGHMNVHRRDRAKLNQPQNDQNLNHEQHKRTRFLFSSVPSSSCSDSVSNINRLFSISDFEGEVLKKEKPNSHDLVVGIGKMEIVRCKRRRNFDEVSMLFHLKPISARKHHLQSAQIMHETILSSAAKEDIDLELRLGTRPKVN